MRIIRIITAIILVATIIISCKSPKKPIADKPCIDESKINPNAICTMEYAPVCGCDGKTYANACMAENSGVTSWTKGECKKEIPCIDESKINPGPCTKEYRPVCGCDGKQYANACLAKRAGLTSWTEGACK